MDDLLLRQQCVLGLQQPGISSKEQNYNLSYTMSCSFILQICVKKNLIITGHSLCETLSVEGQCQAKLATGRNFGFTCHNGRQLL